MLRVNIPLLRESIKECPLRSRGTSSIPIFLVAATISCPAHGAFEHITPGASAAAMGGACVALSGNPWAPFANAGLLPGVSSRTLAAAYSPSPFGLPELSRIALSTVEPTPLGTFGAAASRFGFSLYREIGASLAYGMTVTDDLACGVTLSYYHLSIARYGSDGTLGVDLGLSLRLSDALQWGAAVFNVNSPSIGKQREKLPQVFAAGLCYRPVAPVVLLADIEKDIGYPAEVHAGVQYAIFDVLSLRVGTSTEPSLLAAGAGISYSLLKLEYAFTHHLELGATHQISLQIDLGFL